MAMGQKDATLGDRWLGLFFLILPIGVFGYPFLTHSHLVLFKFLFQKKYVFKNF